MTATRSNWARVQRILCIRLDSIGDVLMTTPALRALKEAAGPRHLTLLTSRAGAEIAKLVPAVDEWMVYEAPWMKVDPSVATPEADLEQVRRLRERAFDGAVIFTVYSQSPLPAAMMCRLAGVPLRLAHCHENPYHLLTDWIPDPEPDQFIRHEVQRQLDLVGAIGCQTQDPKLSLLPPEAAFERIDAELQRMGISPAQPVVLIHPGASAPSRRYDPAFFAESASRLGEEMHWQILFTGQPEEWGLVESIRRAMRAPSKTLVGRLSLAELAALISRVSLVICNNTGPAHMAAALGTPVVDLYALTNPQHTPWQVPSRVLFQEVPCAFCYKSVCPQEHHNCLRLVQPQRVVEAAKDLLLETLRTSP